MSSERESDYDHISVRLMRGWSLERSNNNKDIVVAIARRTLTVITTPNQFDKLNRLTCTSNVPSAFSVVSLNYGYWLADQRTAVTNPDGSYWL